LLGLRRRPEQHLHDQRRCPGCLRAHEPRLAKANRQAASAAVLPLRQGGAEEGQRHSASAPSRAAGDTSVATLAGHREPMAGDIQEMQGVGHRLDEEAASCPVEVAEEQAVVVEER